MLFDDCFRGLVAGASANVPTARAISIKKLLAAPLLASVALMSGILLFEPARAQAVAILAAVTCSSTSPCASEQNKGSGSAFLGTAVGDSIHGISTGSGKSGVFGETDSTSGGYGVKGTNSASKGTAVYGSGGSGTGVEGTTTGFNGVGVLGVATSGSGLNGRSSTGTGVQAISSSGYGLYASSTSGDGLFASSSSSDAIYASSQSGDAIAAHTNSGRGLLAVSYGGTTSALEADNYGTPSGNAYAGDGAHIFSQGGNGAVIENGDSSSNGIGYDGAVGGGSFSYGAIVAGQSSGLFAIDGAGTSGNPLIAESYNSSGNTGFFYVDGSGNIHYNGTTFSYARTRDGSNATAFETKATQASVEDSGTAQLVAGNAFVSLDSAFARTIDLRSPYRVFLTPQGDTRGLYIAGKTPTGFTVRETQGGRGTFAFDYRILAAAAGGTGERMTMVTPAVAARFFPMGASRRQKNEIIPQPNRRAPIVPAP